MAETSTWRPTAPWLAAKARAHLERVRREGVVTVAASDVYRARRSLRRVRWRQAHDCSPNAMPLYVVGIQRSGTEMLMEALKESPEVEIHNESASSRAFVDFGLRSDDVVRAIVTSSRHRVVVFKPLVDSHRIVHLMTGLGTPSRGRAAWIFRSPEGRVRSTLARWPENNRRVLREVAEGVDRWEGRGLSDAQLELVRSFRYDAMTQETASALLWYLRNSLFFELGLDRRDDVLLLSYDRFVAEPERFMRMLCDFAGIAYLPRMAAPIAPRPPATRAALEIDPRVRALCDDLHARLDAELERRLS